MHSEDISGCIKHWNDINVNDLSERTKFFCSACLSALVAHGKNIFNTVTVDKLMNCLQSFSLEDAHAIDYAEVESLQVVLMRALDDSNDDSA